jgi:Plavaka transposase
MPPGTWQCPHCSAPPFRNAGALGKHKKHLHPSPLLVGGTPHVHASNFAEAQDDSHDAAFVAGSDGDTAGIGGQQPHPVLGAALQVPLVAQALPLDRSEELEARFLEWRANCNGGQGASVADARTVLEMLNMRTAAERFFGTLHDADARLTELRAKYPDACWEKKTVTVNVPGCETLPDLVVYVRPLHAYLERLVRTLRITWGFWQPSIVDGERVFDHPCSGMLFEELCKVVERCGAVAAPCMLWSDKVCPFKAGSQSYYPLSLILLNVAPDDIRLQWTGSHVAFLPVLDNNDTAYAHMCPNKFRYYKAVAHAAVLQAVLFPFFQVGTYRQCLDAQGVTRTVAPVFMYYAADHQEAENANGMLAAQWSLCCDNDGELRTLDRLDAALVEMRADQAKNADGVPSESMKSKHKLQGAESITMKLVKRTWLSLLPQDLLDEHPYLRCPAFYTPPDVLHVWDEGIWKYFFRCCVFGHLKRIYPEGQAAFLTASLEQRYAILKKEGFTEKVAWPRPNKLLNATRDNTIPPCGGLQGNEMRAAAQFAPHIMHGIIGERSASGQWVAVSRTKDYLEQLAVSLHSLYAFLKRYNHAHGHTGTTVNELCRLQLRCHKLLLHDATFLQDQKSGWHFPKAWMAFASAEAPFRLSQRWIQWFGDPKFTSTEWGENSLKVPNAVARGSNRNKDSLVNQIASGLTEKAVATRHLATLGLSAAPKTLGTANTAYTRAVQTGDASFPAAFKKVTFRMLQSDIVRQTSFMKGRRGLDKVHRQLAEELGVDIPLDDTIEVVNYAVIIGEPFHLTDTDRTAYQVVYSTPHHRGHKRFSWVAHQVEPDSAEEWYGHVQLLFRYKGKQYALLEYVTAVTDQRLLGGALLSKPGCGLYKYCNQFGVIEAHLIIRREVFLPDLSEHYSRETAPASRKRKADALEATAAPTDNGSNRGQPPAPKQHRNKKKARNKSGDDDWRPPAQAAKKGHARAATTRRRIVDDSPSASDAEDGEPLGAATATVAVTAKGKKSRRTASDYTITRWIRTQLVWGFDGGRPTQDTPAAEDSE